MNRVLSKYKRELVVVIATLAMAAVFTIMKSPLYNLEKPADRIAADGAEWYSGSRHDVFHHYRRN